MVRTLFLTKPIIPFASFDLGKLMLNFFEPPFVRPDLFDKAIAESKVEFLDQVRELVLLLKGFLYGR